jgi:hypothetical protein
VHQVLDNMTPVKARGKKQAQHAWQRTYVADSSVQEFNQQALDSLMQASDASRGKFLDVKFLRNRRLQSAQHQVRHWFTTIHQWLQGSRAVEEVAVNFFEEEVCNVTLHAAIRRYADKPTLSCSQLIGQDTVKRNFDCTCCIRAKMVGMLTTRLVNSNHYLWLKRTRHNPSVPSQVRAAGAMDVGSFHQLHSKVTCSTS